VPLESQDDIYWWATYKLQQISDKTMSTKYNSYTNYTLSLEMSGSVGLCCG